MNSCDYPFGSGGGWGVERVSFVFQLLQIFGGMVRKITQKNAN